MPRPEEFQRDEVKERDARAAHVTRTRDRLAEWQRLLAAATEDATRVVCQREIDKYEAQLRGVGRAGAVLPEPERPNPLASLVAKLTEQVQSLVGQVQALKGAKDGAVSESEAAA